VLNQIAICRQQFLLPAPKLEAAAFRFPGGRTDLNITIIYL